MKRVGTIAVLVSLLALAGTANAFVLSNVDGTWTGWVGGANVNTPSGVANPGYGNQSQDQIRWGTLVYAPPGGEQSGLGFTGSAGGAATVNFGLAEAFQIGELEHFNWPIDIGSNVTDADLKIDMSFTDPAGLNKDFTVTIHVNETPNTPAYVDDIISFPGSLPSFPFSSGSWDYTLDILGFGPSAGNIVDQFISSENASNQTLLWGRITGTQNEQPSIPAPAAVLLASIGTGIIGLLRRRRAL